MKMSMRFEGGQELAATLAALPPKVQRQAAIDALLEAAEPMVAVARRAAPREPGAPDIADNIEAQALRAGKDEFGDAKADTVVWGPIRGFFYGLFLEFGTAKMAAKAFMRPAFDSQAARSLQILRDRLWTNIQSFVLGRDVR